MKIDNKNQGSFNSPASMLEHRQGPIFIQIIFYFEQEMAKHFWVHGDNYMAKALIGMRLYKSMIDNLDVGDKEEEMLENAELVFRTHFEYKTLN